MFTQLKSLLQSKAAQSIACKKEGDAHLKAGRLEKAEEAYHRAIEIDERNADAHVGFASLCNQRQNHVSAKQALAKALAIDAGSADAHCMLGTIAKREGDGAAALGHFERALALRPDFEVAYLELIMLLAQQGQVERVSEIVSTAIAACPDSAAIHDIRGKEAAMKRDFSAAIASFRKAVSLAPGVKEYHRMLGEALDDNGESEQAVAPLEKAVWLDPEFFDARVALARTMYRTGRTDGAIANYRKVVAQQPSYADGHANLGLALHAQLKLDEAAASYKRAIDINPRLVTAHANLGSLLAARGENEAAIACFERVVEIDPKHPMAHYLVALKGGDSERSPSDYVEYLFDFYASNFESHLVKGLKYSVPEKFVELLRPHAPPEGAPKWTVLDLGCGTGLAGLAVAPFARVLVGVDLSSKMLDRARARKLYARLEQLDLMAMMQAEASSTYDLVLAADVFVYIGKLDQLATEAYRLMRPGAIFAFSVESLDAREDSGLAGAQARDYRLNDSGRFAHSAEYLTRLCAQSGFENVSTTMTEHRQDQGKSVEGYLVVWKKSQAVEGGDAPPADGTSRGAA